MGRVLTEDDKKWCEDIMKKHKPYDDDDPIMQQFDGEDKEPMRRMATIAKKFLEGKL